MELADFAQIAADAATNRNLLPAKKFVEVAEEIYGAQRDVIDNTKPAFEAISECEYYINDWLKDCGKAAEGSPEKKRLATAISALTALLPKGDEIEPLEELDALHEIGSYVQGLLREEYFAEDIDSIYEALVGELSALSESIAVVTLNEDTVAEIEAVLSLV